MTYEPDSQALDRVVRKVDKLHSGPRVAQRLLSLTRDPDFELQEVVDCLNHDPALSARLLHLVNSSRYGLSHKISNVRFAATYLGRRSLRLTVLTFALVDTLARGVKGKMYKEYWRRTLTMATVASQLAQRNGEITEDDAYTSGLLADVGVLVLAQYEGERYVPIYDSVTHGPELIAAERQILGFDHASLGARLLEHWDVPDNVVGAVAGHHGHDIDAHPLELAVRGGDLMADALWTSESQYVRIAKDLLQAAFHVDLDDFIGLAQTVQDSIEESASMFGIELQSPAACEQLLAEARRLFADASLDTAIELDCLETAIDELTT